MKIYIPTLNRINGQKTLENLEGIDPDSITFVVRDSLDVPLGYNALVCEEKGIRAARQFIWDTAPEDKFIVMDDDLVFHKRDFDNNKLSKDFDPERLIGTIKVMLEDYSLVGVHPRFMINNAPRTLKENAKIYHVMGFNRNLLPEDLSFRLETGEDHDFHLQALSKGCTTAITTAFAHSDKENAVGGCSEWREDVLQDVQALADLWPEYVKIKANGRPIIYFNKAGKANNV